MRTISLRDQIERLQTIWVLVDEDGTARVAVPLEREVHGLDELPVSDLEVEAALSAVERYRNDSKGWEVLISVLKCADVVERTRRCLPADARELEPGEYDALMSLGMDVPFGPWASSGRATIFLVPSNCGSDASS